MNSYVIKVLPTCFLFITFGIAPSFAIACQPVNHAQFIEGSIQLSRLFWLITTFVAVGIVVLAKLRGNFVIIALVAMGVIFHPSWTASPMYGPNCESNSILFSKILLFLYLSTLIIISTKLVIKRIKQYGDNQS